LIKEKMEAIKKIVPKKFSSLKQFSGEEKPIIRI